MKDAMRAAKRDKRFPKIKVDLITLKIENSRWRTGFGFGSLRGCLVPHDNNYSPSELLRRVKEAKSCLENNKRFQKWFNRNYLKSYHKR